MTLPFARRPWRTALCSAAVLLACAAQSPAATLNYTVYLNTASLTANSNAPFSLDVALSTGAPTPNSDNTVTLSSFIFTGGSLGTVSYSAGGQTGSMSGTVSLTNSGFDNELAQQFSAGVTQIQFSVSMTSNTNNPAPDQFSVSILDGGLNNIPTTNPSGGNTLVQADIRTNQTLNSVATYNSTPTGEAPGVTAAVPEPGSALPMLLGGLGGFWWFVRRRPVRRPTGH